MAAPAKSLPPVVMVYGDDGHAVKARAHSIYRKWCEELGGMDHETIDATTGNSGDSLKVLARLREALQTLPFFGGGKAIWLRDCNFLGDNKTASAKDVTETWSEIAQELKDFSWQNVRLLITADDADKRRTIYKTIEKIGAVEQYAQLSVNDRDWVAKAEQIVLREFKARKKGITDEALGELVNRVGPNGNLLASEAEKLSLYVGDRVEISLRDVGAVCVRNKAARAFALGDALGDRDLANLLRRLDEELWETRHDRDKSEIGLLYGIITKVRSLLFVKEMLAEGWIKPTRTYEQFKSQLERAPKDHLPADKKFNPLAGNPFVLFKALGQAERYSRAELVRAMDLLLQCNRKLVSSSLDESLVLQQTLVAIVGNRDAAGGFNSARS